MPSKLRQAVFKMLDTLKEANRGKNDPPRKPLLDPPKKAEKHDQK